MKFALLALSFVFSIQTFAACPAKAKEVYSSYKEEIKVDAKAYREFYVALKSYRQTDFLETVNTVSIDSAAAYIKGGKLTGYVVGITDGGDESMVYYLLNAKKNLIVGYLQNQSPMTLWFCGNNDHFELEESLGSVRY